MFLKISQNSQENTYVGASFIKNFFNSQHYEKKTHRNFNVTFVKFLRTPFSTTKATFRWGFIVKIVND